jgi:hypothetical protein
MDRQLGEEQEAAAKVTLCGRREQQLMNVNTGKGGGITYCFYGNGAVR